MNGAAVRDAFVDGISFWAPRLPGWSVARPVLAGTGAAPAPAQRRPAPELLPPAERRRAPDSVALAIEVASQACRAAAQDPAALPSVFATTHGDLAITDYMCETLATAPLETSPTKFHNSVHNAAAGYWCIGNQCHAPYTTISAGRYTFAAGLLEALTMVASENCAVLFVAYDIESRGMLTTLAPSRGLVGAGLVLGPARTATTAARLQWSVGADGGGAAARPASAAAELVAGNSMADCLPLFEALACGGRGVALALGPGLGLALEVHMGAPS